MVSSLSTFVHLVNVTETPETLHSFCFVETTCAQILIFAVETSLWVFTCWCLISLLRSIIIQLISSSLIWCYPSVFRSLRSFRSLCINFFIIDALYRIDLLVSSFDTPSIMYLYLDIKLDIYVAIFNIRYTYTTWNVSFCFFLDRMSFWWTCLLLSDLKNSFVRLFLNFFQLVTLASKLTNTFADPRRSRLM